MSAIEFINLEKSYGAVPAVRGINLSIDDGELVVLVGPSGCGKSTLLRMVAGLESISSGQIKIADKDVTRVEPSERDIAMVFQNYALYPHMTVRQNLEYGLKNRRVPRDEIAKRVDEASSILEIGGFLDRRPAQLSGGQRQRVAMGRAIVRHPAAFLFDEPLSNLDAKLRVQMRVEIRRLQRRLRTTSLYVTHDQLEAMTLADRLVVMNAGRIEQVGSPMEVYERPETVFVAGFIGSPPMNLIKLSGAAALENIPAMRGDTDLIGVRPDAISLSEPTEPAMRLRGNVELIEPIGSESHIHLSVEGLKAPVIVSVQGKAPAIEDQSLRCYIPHHQIHPFNSTTGNRTD